MIDELSRVRAFRAGEPPPTEAAERAARDALAGAIGRPARRAMRRDRRWRSRLMPVALLATSAAVVVAVVAVVGSAGTPSRSRSAAAPALNRLAATITGPSLTPHAGQYLYVDSISAYPAVYNNACITVAPDHRQIWIGANGAGMLRETSGPAKIIWAANHKACQGVPRGAAAAGTSNSWFAPGCLALGPTNDWSALSTNPRVLLRQMRRLDGGPRTPAEDFVHIGDFLRETGAPPAIRAAIYRAAALIPGVRLLGWARDHLGRRGLGIAYTHGGMTSELIFDRQTGELLGERATGSLGYWAVYLRERVVNRLASPSPLRLTPPCIAGAGTTHHTRQGEVMTGFPKGHQPGGLQPIP